VEREYLAALAEAVSVDNWRAICEPARDDALAGDGAARTWLAKYLLGAEPLRLVDLAADEADGHTPEAEIEQERGRRRDERVFRSITAFGPQAEAAKTGNGSKR
jgi:hypothetical protein